MDRSGEAGKDGSVRRILMAAATVALATMVAGAAVGAQGGTERAIPDGEWSGIITFTSQTVTGAIGDFTGTFDLDIEGGDVEGSFFWSSLVSTRAGDVPAEASGIVENPATGPRFTITQIISGGFDVPDASGGGTLTLKRVSCERIAGSGLPELGAFAEVDPIDWFALRAGSASDEPAFFADWAAFRDRANAFIADLAATGVLDVVELRELQIDSADLERRLVRNASCSLGGHQSLAADAAEAALRHSLGGPIIACAAELDAAIVIAIQAGVIGSGAEDPDAPALLAEVEAALAARITRAAADGDDCSLLTYIGLARQLGSEALAAAAEAAFIGLGS